jgi:outer membrane protein OmpA-like peptidoglycan-associated protein
VSNIMMKSLTLAVVVIVAAGVAPACATKSFVRKNVADVNERVETLSRAADESREHARVLDGRVSEVDRTAQAAQTSAQRAQSSATSAESRADLAARKADAVEQASKRLMYEVVLSENQGNFAFGKATLPEDARLRIDDLASKIKADPQGAFFEIEGHTDATGAKSFNDELGRERAEAVKRYLYEKHQIPLHRMNVISYGPEKPVAPNKTRDGRAQNRRVVIKVLS